MCNIKHDKNFVMIPNKHLKARNYKIKDKHEIKDFGVYVSIKVSLISSTLLCYYTDKYKPTR